MFEELHNLAEFQQAAAEFVHCLKPLPDRATIVGLYGDLGAGKTAFVQAAAKALGVSETINSPTFLIQKRYMIQDSGFKNLIHIDAYRLNNADELRNLGFADLLADPENLILIEWADRVSDILPRDHAKLFFEFIDGTRCSITSP